VISTERREVRVVVLALLQDGSCSVAGSCLSVHGDVHATCPQASKCGTCVAWSPRKENSYGRNSGQCMLDRTATQYLDCNAPICPYYRPRFDNPAHLEWNRGGVKAQQARVRTATKKMTREAPAPTPEALSVAAFRGHAIGVADAGAPILAGLLEAHAPMPVLLERFRGGTAKVEGPQTPAREVPLEAFFARLALVRRALNALDESIDASKLTADEKEKLGKDWASISGSMTTFNVLLKDKTDHFKGQTKG
jgi:hypothetical protein